jgi:hypothetical protein
MPPDPIVEIGRLEDAVGARGPGHAAINGSRDAP